MTFSIRLFTGLAVAALVMACGKSASPPQAAAVAGSTPVRLQIFGDPAEITAFRELTAAYEKSHPGKKVELIPVGKQADHMAKLSTAFAAGNPPDLFILNFRRFGQFAGRGALAPLAEMMSADGRYKAEDFYPQAVEAFNFQGTQYCLPQNVSSLVVYYNRTLFKEAGVPEPKADWRFADMLAAAQKIRRDTDGDGKTDVWGVAIQPSLIRLAPFIWGMKGALVDDLNKPSMLRIDGGNAVHAMAMVKALVSDFRVAPGQAQTYAEDADSRFARGGVAMLFQSRRYTATLRDLGDKAPDWDVAPFPLLREPVGVLHADAYCMAAKARSPVDAQAFVEYAMSVEGQALLAKSGRTVPSRISVATSTAFLDPMQAPAHAQVFLDAIPLLRRTPNTARWHEVESRADVLLDEWMFEPPAPGEAEGVAASSLVAARLIAKTVQPILLEDLRAMNIPAPAAPGAAK
ncbi:MAG: sugar ABC transporter substrate-binding protein [Thiobacillus sp.]|nr:sugar ABC transporter substrate-binding protein [Thiobacillus sp.]